MACIWLLHHTSHFLNRHRKAHIIVSLDITHLHFKCSTYAFVPLAIVNVQVSCQYHLAGEAGGREGEIQRVESYTICSLASWEYLCYHHYQYVLFIVFYLLLSLSPCMDS
jgi:hypothetical protein